LRVGDDVYPRGVLALIGVLLTVSRPPTAYVATPAGHVRIVISSWCWDTRCGAPLTASKRVAVVSRDSTVRVELGFVPVRARVTIAGELVTPTIDGREVTWRASRGGGISLTAYSSRGWVTYAGRLKVKG
jgi:hypothetical protein